MGTDNNKILINPEEFLRKVFSSSILITITKEDINNLLLKHIKGGNDLTNKKNLEINNYTYSKIVDDIISFKYLELSNNKLRKKKEEDFEDKKIIKSFLEGLFPFINYNNSTNCLIFKLLMCPFILKSTMLFDEKCEILYEYIKCVNFNEKDVNLLNEDIKYTSFCETFKNYLEIILSGYTKVLSESLDSDNYEKLKEQFNENLINLFNPKNIIEYYTKIIEDLNDAKDSKKDENSENEKVNLFSFKQLCEKNPQIIDYFNLRDDFIKFAINKRK